ncbi:MAG: tRNA guanosine(34) transglycosylase Tgt [Acidobacteriota bacterium]
MSGLDFSVVCSDPRSGARCGRLRTPHGDIDTPAFLPVGTYGAVKGLRSEDLEALGVQIVLANAYHLDDRPGADLIARLGGLHRFMGWPGPVLTDSGGYQIFSLSRRCEVDDQGVTFRSQLDGGERRLTPELVVRLQAQLGSDIAMVLDQCIANPADRATAEVATRRTREWAERSRPLASELDGGLFAIVQGSVFSDFRRQQARELAKLDFDGYAVGGLSVGEEKAGTWSMLEAALSELPTLKPRYVMGMGTPADLVEAVARGVDLFDCVIPTRHARNGVAATSRGRVSIRNRRYAEDERPLDEDCRCPTCSRYSRAYLRHLELRGEMLSSILLTWHNLYHYLDSMRCIRQAIASATFVGLRATMAEAASS